jgi:hypothetical protein
MSIITRGYNTYDRIITRGYGTGWLGIIRKEILRFVSRFNRIISVESTFR